MFHDIAKGRGGDHSQLGMLDARRFCRAHGIAHDDGELVEFLVEHHLDDVVGGAEAGPCRIPDVIGAFAAIVQTERRLIALYLLTVADIRGTSPKVWNAWKGKLLEDLFRADADACCAATGAATTRTCRTSRPRRCACCASTRSPTTVEERLWKQLDVAYFLRHDAEEIAWQTRNLHLPRRFRTAGREGAPVADRRRLAGHDLRARPAGAVRAHLRLLRIDRLLDRRRQDPHDPSRLCARHVPRARLRRRRPTIAT